MTKQWLYDDPNSGELRDLNLVLEPGQIFDAPDDWLPEPNPHPVYKPGTKQARGVIDANPATS